jgi:subtilisin-like proprotein convertase family protein
MKQFSSPLHTGNDNFKKQFLRVISLLFAILKKTIQADTHWVASGVVNLKSAPMRKLLFLTITAFFLFSSLTTNGQTNPAVTINQSVAQADPTNSLPINFTAVFDQPVIGFTTGDIVITGTASGTPVAVVTGGPTTYNVSVAGIASCGTVIVNIPAGVCTNTLTQPNLASTSTDNTVTYLPVLPNPNVTINQAITQPDPTSASPINFTVVFDQAVTGFATGDVSLSGTAGATTGIVTGSGSTYNVAVSGITASGTVIATIAAGVCANGCTQPNNASTSTDNTVTINCVPPAVNTVPNQQLCAGSATTPINFTSTPPGATFTWTNSNPLIGLSANGTGNIASFTALNFSAVAVTATITVTPSTGSCTGTPISFTITVNPTPVVNITPASSCGGVAGLYGTLLTASSAPPPVAGSVSVSSGTINLIVPDNTANGVSNNIAITGVPANATITSISVSLNLPHTYPADMIINLKGPSGQILNLFKHNTNTDIGASASIATAGFYYAAVSNIAFTFFASVPTPFRYGQTAPAGPFRPDALNGVTNPGYAIMDPAGFQSNASSFSNLYTTAASTNGTWTLAMADGGRTGDVGILSSWTLTIDYTTPAGSGPTMNYIWSPLAGLYNDPQTTTPYTGVNTAVVYAAPTAFTIYTVTGTNAATGCSGTATTQVNYTPPAAVVTPPSVNMCLGDPAVKLKVVAGGVPATPAIWSPAAGLFLDQTTAIPYIAGTARDSVWVRPTPAGIYTYQVTTQSVALPTFSFTNPAPITINAVGTATPAPVNVSVSGLPTSGVSVQSVIINGFNHSWAGNVNMVLQSPAGQNIILMANSNANPLIIASNVNLTFSDAATGSLPVASPMATGTYLPTNRNGATFPFLAPGPTVTGPTFPASPTLATFTGNMNGTWKLFVEDRVAGDMGSITGGFTINFNAAVAPCTSPPRTVVVTVVNPVTITSHPANQTLCTGNAVAVFSVSVAGSGPNSYQWQLSTNGGTNWNNTPNGGAYAGVTTPVLTINPVTASMNGYLYRLLVNGGTNCSVTSNAGLLTINLLPTAVITANPLIIGPTQTSTISSTVSASPAATYAWYYNGAVLPGEVAATLIVNYGSPGDYQLKVTNVCGVGLSNIITIANSFALGMFSYPNPSGGIFQVIYHHDPNNTTNNTLQRSLTVYNNWGGKIISRNFAQTTNYQKIDIDVRAHGKGIYLVELRDANGKRLGMNRVLVQ